jgi:glycosyltransferase involved in cell wall biosynthesis
VLYVSPHYKSKGGIASVVSQYKKYIGKDFRHFSTIDYSNNLLNVLIFPIKILYFIIYLFINREIKIVHIHGASRGSFYRKYIIFLISKHFFNKKVIYHIHGGEYHLFIDEVSFMVRKKINSFIENTDTLITLSNEWKIFFSNTFNCNSIEIVNNIVPFCDSKEKKENEGTLIRFLFLGNINKGKGIFDVLESVKKNKELFENKIKIKIAGDGEVELLKSIISDYNISNIVEYIGWVTGEEKNLLFLKSDIMLLPSYNEGLPISLLEALSYNMPLISAHVGGISEILEHKRNGFVVDPGNIDQITESLIFYLENKSLIKLHGDNSYQIANRYFPEFVFSQLNNIYKDLLDEY